MIGGMDYSPFQIVNRFGKYDFIIVSMYSLISQSDFIIVNYVQFGTSNLEQREKLVLSIVPRAGRRALNLAWPDLVRLASLTM
jgi:hypothetical protein